MYSYPQSHPSSSRPSYSIQTPPSSKDDGQPPAKHHAGMYMGQGNMPSIPPRSECFIYFRSREMLTPYLCYAGHVPRNPGPPMSQGL